MVDTTPYKPLGRNAYGSIPHLPSSRLGQGEHSISPGQARICCERKRDRHDRVYIQEKLDGSCTAVTKLDSQLHALGRAGYLAASSPYEMHQMFAVWVEANYQRIDAVLQEGETLVGEWLAQAHSTRYSLFHDPWVPFDLMTGVDYRRSTLLVLVDRLQDSGFTIPHVIAEEPTPSDAAMKLLASSYHGAIDPVEGAVWRVERQGKVDFLAKFVRQDKVDGIYLPEISGEPAIWNWHLAPT